MLELLLKKGVVIGDTEHPGNLLYDTFHFIEQTFNPDNKNVTAYKAAKTQLQQNPLYPEIAACYDEKKIQASIDQLLKAATERLQHLESRPPELSLGSPEQIANYVDNLSSKQEEAKQAVKQVEELRAQINQVFHLRKKVPTSENVITLKQSYGSKPQMHADRGINVQLKRPTEDSTRQAKERINPLLKQQQEVDNIDKGFTHHKVHLDPDTDKADTWGNGSKQHVRKRLAEMRSTSLPR
jgi:hypothetical protein